MNRNMSRVLVGSLTVLLLNTATSVGQLDGLWNKIAGTTAVSARKIAHFKIEGALTETPSNIPPLFGDEPPMSLQTLLERLKKARLDGDVVAVVIDLQNAMLPLGQLEELHDSLRKFTAVDKHVYIHGDTFTTITYAAATGASKVSVVPTGDVWLIGFLSEAPYLKGTLDKMGCAADFEQCGDFKTAAEPLMRAEPSEPSKQMRRWLLDSLYESTVKMIAESRGMTPEKVRSLIDNGPYSAEEALAAGLIDAVQHRQDFVASLKGKYGENVEIVGDYGADDDFGMPDMENPFAMFSFLMKMLNPAPKVYTEPSVAIIYVEGMIQPGEEERFPFSSSGGAYSTTIRKALDKAAEDDSVKAVVLRVDSPGGSALASEIIWDATKRLIAKKKPFVVSMGNVAGSGGYYVSCAADTIFADRMTITASIGVIGGKIVTTGGWQKLGVNWHGEQRGEMAGILSSSERFDDKERAKIRHYMDTVYDIFKKHVTDARGKRLKKPIDEIAGGRVFTGAQALDLGLVDKIGGLEDAVKFAAERAGLGQYEIRVIPEPPTIFDLFMPQEEDGELVGAAASLQPSLMESPFFQSLMPVLSHLDPLRVRAMVETLESMQLIHREGVAVVMPGPLVIR